MLSKLHTASIRGLNVEIIDVEVDYRKGTNFFAIIGLADKSIQEAKERIPSAIKNSGFSFVPMQIIINLAPAQLIKSGSGFDLPLSMGYLLASEQLAFNTSDKLFLGELSLDGTLKPVNGVLPIVMEAKKKGFKEFFIPSENAKEANLVSGIDIYPAKTLIEVVQHFQGGPIPKYKNKQKIEVKDIHHIDFSSIVGQHAAKRALEISATGGHNCILNGTPGSGKSMLSKAFKNILPSMNIEESLEVTKIYSVAGLLDKNNPYLVTRPFRAPHHTISHIALVGGGLNLRPGEITLANKGVLFLDEFPEFEARSIEVLRQPLEDKVISISRSTGTIEYPADFLVLAAMNPCKCGYFGDKTKECICSAKQLNEYKKRISGPIMDRFDLQVWVDKIDISNIDLLRTEESSQSIKQRVIKARAIQEQRYKGKGYTLNSQIPSQDINKYISISTSSKVLLRRANEKFNLSTRSYFKILKVARTIADLSDSSSVEEPHLLEALSYRFSN